MTLSFVEKRDRQNERLNEIRANQTDRKLPPPVVVAQVVPKEKKVSPDKPVKKGKLFK